MHPKSKNWLKEVHSLMMGLKAMASGFVDVTGLYSMATSTF